ncbi:hypothetical protein BC828DRAFT_403784 [Blastocladiella britannica]|nr:hypothetical protein BC828DRAFT_403784 [Blastocladiella britannica]
MAMRLAIELGLHQSQMFMLHRRGQPNAALPSPSAMTVYSKAWCCCYVLDQQIAYKFGRPASVGAGDVVLSFDFVIDTAENRLRFPGSELDPPDAPWIWHARLVDIFGKISRTINNMYLRRHLAHSLPELHALLLDYQKQLPASLRFDVNDESTQRSVAVSFLHLLYYSAVLSLYRPFLSSRLFHTDSVLRKQHFAIVEKCVTAIPTISLQHMTSPLARLYSPVYMMHVFAGCCSLLECSPTVEQRQRVLSVLHLSARVIEGSVAQAPDYSTVLRLLCFEFAHRVSNDDAFEPFGSPCFKDDPGPKPTSEARTESLERELDIIMDQIVDVELLASEICGAQGVRTDPARERFEVGASARALERELCAYFGRPVPPFSAASATPATAAPTTAPPVAVPATPPMSFESASQASDGQSTRYGVVGSGTGIPPHLHYPFTSPPPPRATAPSMAHYYSDPSTFMQPNRTAPPAASDSFAPLHWDPMQLDPGHLPLFPPALTSHDPNVIAPDFGSVDIGGGEAAEALGGFGRGPPAPAFSFESIVQPGAGLGMGMGLSMPMGMGMGMGMSMGLGMPMSMSMGMGMGAFPLESATPPTHHHPRPPPPVPSSGGDEFMRQLGQLLQ